MQNFVYYKLQLKLTSPMLGTNSEASIYNEHVIESAKKEIEKANKLGGKIVKSLDKYRGEQISENKQVMELQGIIRNYCQLLGKPLDVPDTLEDLLKIAEELKEEFEESIKKKENTKATIFQKDKDGYPQVSTHMVLGNLKENMKIIVNNGDKDILKSKVSVGEVFALDVKFVEKFMRPSMDIMKGTQEEADALPVVAGRWVSDQKNRILLERTVRMDQMGKTVSAISSSEALPEGTILSCTLRVRANSPINQPALEKLLDLGKSNGLGAWRGSGSMGSYNYKIEELKGYTEELEDGWK